MSKNKNHNGPSWTNESSSIVTDELSNIGVDEEILQKAVDAANAVLMENSQPAHINSVDFVAHPAGTTGTACKRYARVCRLEEICDESGCRMKRVCRLECVEWA